jgi:hypothetical protein
MLRLLAAEESYRDDLCCPWSADAGAGPAARRRRLPAEGGLEDVRKVVTTSPRQDRSVALI